MNQNARLVEITWNTNLLSGGKPFGSHSILQMRFSDGSIWHTEKYVEHGFVIVEFTPGSAPGQAFRGPLRGQDLKEQGLIWRASTTARDILRYVESSSHMEMYNAKDFNCHCYAQDVWNFCAIFQHQVWWRPEMVKAKLLGGLLVPVRVGYDDWYEDDWDYDDCDDYDDWYEDDWDYDDCDDDWDHDD